MEIERAVADTEAIFRGALSRVEPEKLVRDALRLSEDALLVQGIPIPLSQHSRLVVVAIGKAAVAMVQGANQVLGTRINRAVAVTKRGVGDSDFRLSVGQVIQASHPVPDESSVAAGMHVLEAVADLGEDDLVLALISGGGSALVEAPVDSIILEDIAASTNLMLRAGADIQALNAVRRRLSRIKAGGLARVAAPARIVNLIISDVLGSPLPVIASGPTVEASGARDAREVAAQFGVWSQLPRTVQRVLDLPPSDDAPITNVVNSTVLADAAVAAHAAAEVAASRGYTPMVLATRLEGEAREFGRFWAALAREAREGASAFQPPACLIGAGEMTVTVRGEGVGGRNTEMALAAALDIHGVSGLAIASLATDGDDGLSGGAGGVVVGTSVERARRLGLDPVRLLSDNDSAQFLKATGGFIGTQPTGTNVNDLYLALIP